jgi:hypothetical protein
MVAENNLIQFNSHKNIAIKEMREKKRKEKIKQEHKIVGSGFL